MYSVLQLMGDDGLSHEEAEFRVTGKRRKQEVRAARGWCTQPPLLESVLWYRPGLCQPRFRINGPA
jgi:hypothetical protein